MSATLTQSAQKLAKEWCQSILSGVDPVTVTGVRQGWGALVTGQSFEDKVLRIGKQEFTQGFATHADSEILVRSLQKMIRFGATVGFDRNRVTWTGEGTELEVFLVFSIEVNGTELWQSEPMTVHQDGETIDLSLPEGTREVVLKVKSVTGNFGKAHGDWAEVWVDLEDGKRIQLGKKHLPRAPFSFLYGGRHSGEILSQWTMTQSSRPGPRAGLTEHTIRWDDPKTGLQCRMELVEFADHPAIEWVLHFRNNGATDSPILENVQALDAVWEIAAADPTTMQPRQAKLYRSRGSTLSISDFEYREETLLAGESVPMRAGKGRSSEDWLPFFNCSLGEFGIITAIGWSGQWACSFDHEALGKLRMRAGMENTHLLLHPGEEIRTPRIAQLFWCDDRIAGHNDFRQFILEHHTPRLDDKPITGPFTIAHWGGMKTESQIERIAQYKKERLPHDYLWVDAGWYGLKSGYSPDEHAGDWAQHTGDWRVNPKAHPNGLKPIAEAARKAGMKFMLWVEPGRAVQGTPWPEQHPDWFLNGGHHLLLDLGNPEALQGAIELLSKIIHENDVSLYREDYNIDPLIYWRGNDAPNRQGMTEIRAIEGLYTFWDTLLERHPGLIIDNCASGGRRIDLETIGRSVALWRDDWQCYPDHDPVGSQVQGIGLSYWLPLHGTGTWASMPTAERTSTYLVRSAMGPAFQLSASVKETNPVPEDYPWDWLRRMCADYLRARPLYTGDFYPLTEGEGAYHRQWAVYQMDRPDLGQGFVMAFRRTEAPWSAGTFKLKGLKSEAVYSVEDADTKTLLRTDGKALSEGFEILLPRPNSSALFFYTRV